MELELDAALLLKSDTVELELLIGRIAAMELEEPEPLIELEELGRLDEFEELGRLDELEELG